MKKNKKITILISILILLIAIIILLIFNIKNKSTFTKPEFDTNATTKIPEKLNYKSSIINISEGYSIYIDGIPHINKDDIIINFISIEDNKVWIKIRLLDEEKNIVAESGLIKPGEYLKSLKTKKKIKSNDKITYMIMGYEIDTYMSAGTVELNTKVGD